MPDVNGGQVTPEITERLDRLEKLITRINSQHAAARKELQEIENQLQIMDLRFSASTSRGISPELVFGEIDGEDMVLYLKDWGDRTKIEEMNAVQLSTAKQLLPELLDALHECHIKLEVR